jgi:Possible tRNA binding domain
MVDHHMIGDILPTLARLLFLGRLKGISLLHPLYSRLKLLSQRASLPLLAPLTTKLRFFSLTDTLPLMTCLSRLYPGMRLSYLQVAILLATGLQHRDVDAVSAELDLPVNQVLAFFNKV